MKIKNRWFFTLGIWFWILGILNTAIHPESRWISFFNFILAIIFTALSIKEEK